MNKPSNKLSVRKKPLLLHFPPQEQALFAKRLGMILRSGMPIMEGLQMLGGSVRSRSATYMYGHLIEHVESGRPLSTGLEKFRKIFGEFCINIVRVGESSGTLHENLEYLAEDHAHLPKFQSTASAYDAHAHRDIGFSHPRWLVAFYRSRGDCSLLSFSFPHSALPS